MNFGNLDRQLVLQRPTSVPQDAFGAPAPAGFEDVAKVWGWMKPGPATETFIGEQQTPHQVVSWVIRYRRDVLPTWQLTSEGKLYQITAIAEIGRRAALLLTTYSRGPIPKPIPPHPVPPAPAGTYQLRYRTTY